MNCPRCGSEVTDGRCAVCGYQDPTLSSFTTSAELAGWWRRVGATLTDDLILVLPTLLVAELVGSVAGNVAGGLCGFALQGLYMVNLIASSTGQTLGNRIAASRVRDARTNLTVTRQQALRRWGFIAAYGVIGLIGGPMTYVTALVGLVDVLYPLFDARNQTLHDKFAGTIVIKA